MSNRYSPDHEGLQYIGVSFPDMHNDGNAPEVVPFHSAPEYYEPPASPCKPDSEFVPGGARPVVSARIFGMKRRTFFIVAAIAALIVIIGGVVGGVVGSKSNNTSKTTSDSSAAVSTTPSTTTSTPTSTTASTSSNTSSTSSTSTTTTPTTSTSTSASSTTTSAFPTDTILPWTCSNDGGTYNSVGTSGSASSNYSFLIACGKSYSPGSQYDLAIFKEYTLENCIDRCANYDAATKASTCKGVVFASNLTEVFVVVKLPGNCFLKNDMSNPDGDSPVSAAAVLLSPL